MYEYELGSTLSGIQIGSLFELRTGRRFSSSEFIAAIDQRTAALIDIALKPGEMVFLYQNNSLDFFVNLFACWRLNACVAPLDFTLPTLFKDELAARYSPALIIENDGQIRRLAPYIDSFEARLDDGSALLLTTSGSTGVPKGVIHSFQGLKSKIQALDRVVGPETARKTLCALPTYFGHGLVCNSLYPLLTGQDLIIAPSFTPALIAELADVVRKNGISFFSSTPVAWRLVEQFANSNQTMRTLMRVHCASAPLMNTHASAMFKWSANTEFWNVYGLTEFLGWIAGASISESTPPGYIGPAWDVEAKVDLETGELLLKGPSQSPQIKDWYHTRDLGVIDTDGNITLKGRLDFVINKGGLKIFPEAVEQAANTFSGVRESYCYAVADHLRGEKTILAAAVETQKLSDVSQFKLALETWLRARLPAYQIPDVYFINSSLPYTPRGKIDRQTLVGWALRQL